jgi:NAD(P)H-hydrate epimerase
MTPVLSRAQMREFDAHATRPCNVPSLLLMENAGLGAAQVLARELCGGSVRGARIVVACGTGNNGGDGFVVARHLAIRGARASVFVAGDAHRVMSDARTNLEAWRGVGGEVKELPTGTQLSELRDAMAEANVVVDALFGTGLDRPVEGWHAEVIRAINRAEAPKIALDLPSGLDADTGVAFGPVVEASVTATFAHHKLGLLTPNGARHAGRVHIVDIGVPGSLVGHIGSTGQLLQVSDLTLWMDRRTPGVHKSAAGHVLIVAGSLGKSGAARLVARAAMRAGAGMATIATWAHAADAIESNALEVMTERLDRAELSRSLDRILEGKDCVVVGPGLGLDEDARTVVEYLLAAWRGPVVVDADALTMFAGRPSVFMASRNAILTPHPGELGRLLGKTAAHVEADRYRASRELVAATGANVVLKGAHTIIAAPDSGLAVSPVVCPALATAGSGDVLSGITGAMALSLPAFEAACAGVLLHGLAGQEWSKARGGCDRGLLASEIADALPGLLSTYTRQGFGAQGTSATPAE